jgi:membrane protein DedA with SNARE-associated domain
MLGRICGICLEPDSCVRRAKNLLERYGLPMLLLAKFVPGLNAVAAPLAGTIRIPWWQFAAIDSLGFCIWAATFEPLGFAFADQLQRVGIYAWRSSAVVVATAPSVYSPPTLLESVWHGNGFFETFGWLGLVRRNLRRSCIDMSRSPW